MSPNLLAVLLTAFFAGNLLAFALGKPNADGSARSIPWLQRSTSLMLAALAIAIAATRAPGAPLGRYAALIAVGMSVSFVADLIMASKLPNSKRVLLGMLTFGLAHLVYMAAMLFGARALTQPTLLTLVLCEAALLGIGALIWARVVRSPSVPAMLNTGSLGYLVLLGSMTAMACAFALTDARWAMLAVGALLFLASDAILGNQIFRENRWPLSSEAVWGTYILGQAGIVLSTLAVAGL